MKPLLAQHTRHRSGALVAGVVVCALSLVLAACGATSHSSSAQKSAVKQPTTVTTTTIPKVTGLHRTGRAVTHDVSANAPLKLTVPGVAVLHGPAGSFAGTGAITVYAGDGSTAVSTGLHVAGTGVDVAVLGTKLLKPLQVTFLNAHVKTAASAIPVVVHRADNGHVDLKPATVDAAGHLVVVTKEFSWNLPSWLDPIAWIKNLWSSVTDSLADAVTGRTDPLPCKNNGPSWASVASGSDMIHLCEITNPDANGVPRAEVQIRSNRLNYMFVKAPSGSAYVWAQDYPTPIRTALAFLGAEDPGTYVVLAPNELMTAGFYRPQGPTSLAFTVGDDPLTNLISLIAPVVGALVGDANPVNAFGAAAVLAGKCLGQITGIRSASDIISVFRCITGVAGSNLDDPVASYTTAKDLFGPSDLANATAGELDKAAGGLKILGKVFVVVGIATLLRDLINSTLDQFISAVTPDANQATLVMVGSGSSSSSGGSGGSGGSGATGGSGPSAGASGPVSLSIGGSCTSNGGTLSGTGDGFTPGGTATYRAWYPNGSPYTNLRTSGTVRSDGSVPWTWPCAGDPAGTYTTTVTDNTTGHTTPVTSFHIGAVASTPPPQPPPQPAQTYTEQEATKGANTFTNPVNASGEGPRLEPETTVQVSCKLHPATTIGSASPDGYWYRIASTPWNNAYYAVSNTFWNGDTPGQSGPATNTDFNVPDC